MGRNGLGEEWIRYKTSTLLCSRLENDLGGTSILAS
jgi:hypothetical protein